MVAPVDQVELGLTIIADTAALIGHPKVTWEVVTRVNGRVEVGVGVGLGIGGTSIRHASPRWNP